MNKKVVLSVLATAVVASMATSAFAKPSAGLYIGGTVDKYYSLLDFVTNETAARAEINSVGLTNVVYVDGNAKAATVVEIALADTLADALETATEADFAGNVYTNASTGAIYDPSTDTDIGGVAGEFELEGVTALNLKQVKFTFNKEIKDTTVATATFFQNGGVMPAGTPELQDDGKTVIYTFTTAQVAGTSFAYKVDNIEDVDGNELDSAAFTVTFTDTVKPTIAKAEYNGTAVVVTFSEPLSAEPDIVRVNGTPVSVVGFSAGDSSITTGAVTLAAGSTATLYVAGAADAAGNTMELYIGSFAVPVADVTKPFVTGVTQVAQNKVRVAFSEALKATDELATGDIQVVKGATVYNTGIIIAKNTADASGKTYDVTIDLNGVTTGDGIFAEGSSSQALTLLLAENLVSDAADNKNDAYTTTVTLTRDATAPAFVSGKIADDKTAFELAFNEDLTFVSGANIIVTDANGVRYTVDASGLKGTDAKVLLVDIVPLAGVTASGTYTISVPAGAVTDDQGNANAAFTTSVVVGSATNTDTAKPVPTISSAVNKFTVVYNDAKTTTAEEVTSTALNLANYKLDGAALPAGSQIYFTSTAKDTVEILLPENSINIGMLPGGTTALLTVSGVADKAGNVADTKSGTVTIGDNTAAVLQSAALAGDQLTLTFSENLDAGSITDTNYFTNFQIKGGTVTLDTPTAAGFSVVGNKVYATIGATNWTTVKAASTVTVETYATGSPTLQDANDLAVKAGVKVNVAK